MCAPCERVRRGSEAATLVGIIHECRREAPQSAFLVTRISRRPSFVKREAYLASRKINACERRDTRYERRVRNDASRASAAGRTT